MARRTGYSRLSPFRLQGRPQCDPSAYARSSSGRPANLVQLSVFAVVQKLAERRLVHLVHHVAKLLVIAAALGEVVAIAFPERADRRIAVLAADGRDDKRRSKSCLHD